MRQIGEDTLELYRVTNATKKKTNGVEMLLFIMSHNRGRMVTSMALKGNKLKTEAKFSILMENITFLQIYCFRKFMFFIFNFSFKTCIKKS